MNPNIDEDVEQDDYDTYVRLRSFNSVLVSAAIWAGTWMIAGAIVAAVGYLRRPEPDVVGVDPAGRGWELTLLDRNGKPVHRK